MTGKKRLSIPILSLLLLHSAVTWAEAVWIDVRSAMEHAVDSIEGDPRITHDEIVEGVSQRYPDKATEIHLYCRSGGRAGQAVEALQQAGYTNVTNAGGIDDARETRGLSD